MNLLTSWITFAHTREIHTRESWSWPCIWGKVSKNVPSQSNFSKAVFQNFNMVHSWTLCPIYVSKNFAVTSEGLQSWLYNQVSHIGHSWFFVFERFLLICFLPADFGSELNSELRKELVSLVLQNSFRKTTRSSTYVCHRMPPPIYDCKVLFWNLCKNDHHQINRFFRWWQKKQ